MRGYYIVKDGELNNRKTMKAEYTEEELKAAMDKAYWQSGQNAYFNNGFLAGVRWVEEKRRQAQFDKDSKSDKDLEEWIDKDKGAEEILRKYADENIRWRGEKDTVILAMERYAQIKVEEERARDKFIQEYESGTLLNITPNERDNILKILNL
jgi:hypothetical protein